VPFGSRHRHTVTIDSNVDEIGLQNSWVVPLEYAHAIFTIRELILMDVDALRKLKGLSEGAADTIVLTVENSRFPLLLATMTTLKLF
jgi:hypothetical protein